MEESEAQCTRMAIIVNGQLKCLGTIGHLKNKFGIGFTLTATIDCSENDIKLDRYIQPFKNFVESTFPFAKVIDIVENVVEYFFITDLSWAQIVRRIESASADLNLEDYFLSQTSLEQVFIHFSRMQRPPDVHAVESL